MKVVNVKLSEDLKEIEVIVISDVHIGDKFCNMKLLMKTIEYIKNTPNCFCILNGDLLNNAIKSSVSDCYAEEIPPNEQFLLAYKLFYEIRDKILCITNGNHENRTCRESSFDLSFQLADRLGIPERYSKEAVLLFLSLGKEERFGNAKGKLKQVNYSFYIIHGTGGGRKDGGKANALVDLASIIDTDIYIHSHTHQPLILPKEFIRVDRLNKSAVFVEKLFVNSSAMLDYGGYAEQNKYTPPSKRIPKIILSGTKKQFNLYI